MQKNYEIKVQQEYHCSMCPIAKQRRKPFPKSYRQSTKPSALIHVNIRRPYKKVAIYGERYFLSVVDDFSRFTWLFLLKDKSEARLRLQNFCAHIETQFGTKIKTIGSNNGQEFYMPLFYSSKSIIHQTSSSNTRAKGHEHGKSLKVSVIHSSKLLGILCIALH